jgi:hypothetical protein
MDKLSFVDPGTGNVYSVLPAKPTVLLAERLGYIPADEQSWDAADVILGRKDERDD